MKPLTLTFAIAAAGVAIQQGWIEDARAYLTHDDLSAEAQLAIEIRCDDLDADLVEDCRDDLSERYVAGALDPEATLRAHCTRFNNAWEESVPAPPALCVERYGGWRNG